MQRRREAPSSPLVPCLVNRVVSLANIPDIGGGTRLVLEDSAFSEIMRINQTGHLMTS